MHGAGAAIGAAKRTPKGNNSKGNGKGEKRNWKYKRRERERGI